MNTGSYFRICPCFCTSGKGWAALLSGHLRHLCLQRPYFPAAQKDEFAFPLWLSMSRCYRTARNRGSQARRTEEISMAPTDSAAAKPRVWSRVDRNREVSPVMQYCMAL